MEAMDARTLESVAHTLDDRDEDAPDDPGPRELLPRETPLQRYDAASNKQAFLDTLQREDPDGFFDLDRYLMTRRFVEEPRPGPPVAAAVAQLAQLTQMFQEMAEVGYGDWRELQLEHMYDEAAADSIDMASQTGEGLSHMREMLGSGARREQRLQQIAQAVEMRGSGAPNTRPSAQVLQISSARVTRKPVTGNPHVGASAPTIIAGSGLTAPAPGYHYMATGELMKDPE